MAILGCVNEPVLLATTGMRNWGATCCTWSLCKIEKKQKVEKLKSKKQKAKSKKQSDPLGARRQISLIHNPETLIFFYNS